MLAEAMEVEVEVEEYINVSRLSEMRSGANVWWVRNGHHRERELTTGVGKIPIQQPRVNDRREGENFSSAILPRYLRRHAVSMR